MKQWLAMYASLYCYDIRLYTSAQTGRIINIRTHLRVIMHLNFVFVAFIDTPTVVLWEHIFKTVTVEHFGFISLF